MSVFLVAGTIVVPFIMFLLQKVSSNYRLIFNIAAIISTLIFGTISSLSIYQIIKDNTVFMTEIHAVFLNPFFLVTGAYIGLYILYRLLLITTEERGQ
ncbi:transposase [Virgibacillus siamensis]|uniref:transposase n=1 Tax=Virgibacillus siamensis TaxID=480071 RepID=UPI0011155699|nr:transposase [Virgibacillus siamensis]